MIFPWTDARRRWGRPGLRLRRMRLGPLVALQIGQALEQGPELQPLEQLADGLKVRADRLVIRRQVHPVRQGHIAHDGRQALALHGACP